MGEVHTGTIHEDVAAKLLCPQSLSVINPCVCFTVRCMAWKTERVGIVRNSDTDKDQTVWGGRCLMVHP